MEITLEELRVKHPRFRGNWEDLRQFELLARSRIRSDERGKQLQIWKQYKLRRQIFAMGPGGKGAYMRALLARVIDLTGADLDKIIVGYADLRGAILDNCSLRGAWLKATILENASLRSADISSARLLYSFMGGADLTNANCQRVDFGFASLNDANLSQADFSGADLSHVSLIRANVDRSVFLNTHVYGISAWDLKGTPAIQQDLFIDQASTLGDKNYFYVLREIDELQVESGLSGIDPAPSVKISASSALTVDNLQLAQFIHLLILDENIRGIIDTITSKVVLILGRFSKERKAVLDALRDELRRRDYLPILFDFDKPAGRDITETVSLLARMARFVVADITDAKSIPQELGVIVPDLPSVPVQPLLLEGSDEYSMFEHFRRFPWVLKPYRYESQEQLIGNLADRVIGPAEAKVLELRQPPQA
jgi:uncharacterized protein YjbI with pentapeptide repeats